MKANEGSALRAVSQIKIESSLHPVWRAFVRYCLEMRHGEIEKLKIQDGLPVLAELTKKKVKFTP
jgi:hypothetical protein